MAALPVHFYAFILWFMIKEATHQLTVVCCQLVGVGVGEEQQLRVGVDGEVSLDGGLVLADEIGDVLDLDLRLGS